MNISYIKLLRILAPWVILAIGMSFLRTSLTDSTRYLWMNWNLFLAIIPVIFAYLFERNHHLFIRSVLFLAWLLFLPNAVYMVTDFIHINTSPEINLLWYDGIMLFSYALIGVAISVITLVRVGDVLYQQKYYRIAFYGIISVLVSFGIYLGRYIRWNTWHIITRPIELFKNIFEIVTEHVNEPTFYLTMIFFSLLSIVSIISYKQLIK